MVEYQKIIDLIYSCIQELNSQEGFDIPLDESTKIFGISSDLDSLALVNLIVLIEEKVEEDFEKSITLADEKAMSQSRSPFRTIGTLAEYIQSLL
jgi:D-alanine--poly(phosphoribitol) ligase subunit 2